LLRFLFRIDPFEARLEGSFAVVFALVADVGLDPLQVFTLPNGTGTRHGPLVWNVAEDDAAQTLEAVAGLQLSWGMLFWVPLMSGGGEASVTARWQEVVSARVEDPRMRDNLVGIALVFAELVGRGLVWKRVLEEWKMTESQIVNEWMSQGAARAKLEERRRSLLRRTRENNSHSEQASKGDLGGRRRG
jgi:hypothetical protein